MPSSTNARSVSVPVTADAQNLPFTDLEAEEWVVGSCIASNEILERIRLVVEPRDIFRGWNRRVYEAALAVADAGEEVELGSVTLHLANAGKWDHRTDTAQLIGLLNRVPNPHNAAYYAKRVEEVAALRRLAQAGSKVSEAAYTAKGSAEDGIKAARQLFDQMTVRRQQSTFREMGPLMSAYYDHVDQITNGNGPTVGIPTGFVDLDRLLGGLQLSDLVIVAARPGVGKTSFALSLAMHAAHARYGVGLVSLEMSQQQVAHRMVSMRSRVDGNAIRAGNAHNELADVFSAIGYVSDLPIYIDDTPGLTGADLRSKVAMLCARNEVNLLVLDYLQLMGTTGTRDNRQQEISDISRTCKAIAREHNLPFVVVSQLNRQVESRTDHVPQLSDLRDSGQIEQDADVVLFLHREQREAGNGPVDGSQPYPVRLTVAKQRSGPTGEVDLMFAPRFTLFQSLERRHSNGHGAWSGAAG